MSLVGAPVTLIGPNDPENPGDEATLVLLLYFSIKIYLLIMIFIHLEE